MVRPQPLRKIQRKTMNNPKTSIIPFCLLLLYVVEAVLLGIAPVDRSVWWAENLTAWIPIAVIVMMYWRGIRFSNTAYCLMFIFFALPTIGGHYTFEHVPIDAVTRLFGFERNHVITGKGPFTAEENLLHIKRSGARILVTKESGKAGGYPEKAEAARLAGIEMITLTRPAEDGYPPERMREIIGELAL